MLRQTMFILTEWQAPTSWVGSPRLRVADGPSRCAFCVCDARQSHAPRSSLANQVAVADTGRSSGKAAAFWLLLWPFQAFKALNLRDTPVIAVPAFGVQQRGNPSIAMRSRCVAKQMFTLVSAALSSGPHRASCCVERY